MSIPVWEQVATDQTDPLHIVPRQVFTPFEYLLISVAFVVLCHIGCLWVTGVNSVDPDKASPLGIHCFRIQLILLLNVSKQCKWGNYVPVAFSKILDETLLIMLISS